MNDWSEQDKAALLALLTRYTRAFIERQKDQALKAEIDKRIQVQNAAVSKLSSALSVFGLDTAKAGWSAPIRAAVGDRAYEKAQLAGGRDPSTVGSAGRSPSVTPGKPDTNVADTSATPDTTVRALALDELRAAAEKGTTAAAIRDHIESIRNIKLHYKTVGMTLYRLKEDGLARREGRTWFAVPETVNPGAATPGLSKSAN